MKKVLIIITVIFIFCCGMYYLVNEVIIPRTKANEAGIEDNSSGDTLPCTNVVDITGDPVTWEQTLTDSLNGKTISIEGYAELPFLMMIDKNRASVHFTSRMNQATGGMIILMVEQGTCENMIRELPEDYDQDDMIFMDNSGENIVYGECMRITGKAKIVDGKYEVTVKKIEKAEGGFDYEKESQRLTDAKKEKLDGELVYAEGFLSTPDEQNGVRLDMFLEDESLSFIPDCMIDYGKLNNQARDLPEDGYSDADIRIKDNTGQKVYPGDKVRVYGVWKNETGKLWVEQIVLLSE